LAELVRLMGNELPRKDRALAWLFVLIVLGYPFFAIVGILINVESLSASIPLRLIVVLLAGYIFCKGGFHRLSSTLISFGMFCFFYLLRLFFDLGIANIGEANQALTFFVVTVFLPCLALLLWRVEIPESFVALRIALMGVLTCVLVLVSYQQGLGGESNLTENHGQILFLGLNAITIGHLAVTSLIAALVCFDFSTSLYRRSFMLLIGGCALALLFVSEARGPVISLVVAVMVFAIVRKKAKILLASIVTGTVGVFWFGEMLFERMGAVGEDESSLGRLEMMAGSIDQFVQHPWFGASFIEPITLSYPHNLFIEILLALGLVGMLVFLPALFGATRSAVVQMRQGKVLMSMLFFQYLVGAQFSGAIYGNSALWAVMIILLNGRIDSERIQPSTTAGNCSAWQGVKGVAE
jgi:O-antigen ligase